VIHVETGIVRIATGATNVYGKDEGRELERWLLNTGKPHMTNEHFEVVEREFG
jgi:hypothetical protein